MALKHIITFNMLVNNQLLIYNISKNNLFLFFMNKQIILKI